MKKRKSTRDIEHIVKDSDHSVSEIAKRENTVEKYLSDKYTDVIYWDTPGPRINFKVLWGPSGEERIAKTDGSTNNPRASRHMSRGCDTVNELLKMSAFDEPELYHINPILDYFEAEEDGKKVMITIEKFRKGYVSLDTYIKANGALDNRTSEIIFSKYLKAETYLMKKMANFNIYHGFDDARGIHGLLSNTMSGAQVKETHTFLGIPYKIMAPPNKSQIYRGSLDHEFIAQDLMRQK